MARYAIGDVQGCFQPLQQLVAEFDFNPSKDQLWFTGDLVNRGPDSAQVLRWVRDLGEAAVCVLGNHDLHLLAYAEGICERRDRDTLDDVLAASDADELLNWLRRRPLMVIEGTDVLLHAGLAPNWSVEHALLLAREVEQRLRAEGAKYRKLLKKMYGNEPAKWDDALTGADRRRVIINAFTRLRFCSATGQMGLCYKGPPGSQPARYLPWYNFYQQAPYRFIFGHWSTHGDNQQANALCIDHGCVWGGRLTAVRLDTSPPQWYSVSCRSQQIRHED